MSSLDLIARHYLLRTTNTTVHATVDSPSMLSTRFTDGEGMCWLFLQLSRYSLDVRQGTAGIGDASGLTTKGWVQGREEVKDGDVDREENVYEALVELLKQHCASPKWRINLELDTPESMDGKPKSKEDAEQFLCQILPTTDATMDKVEGMLLDSAHIRDEGGTASNQASQGSSSALEGWEIRDGRAWFSKAFPSRAALVDHEEVWVFTKAGLTNELDGDVENEVGGYITTLSDLGTDDVTRDNGDGRNRVYISSLLIYPSHRRKGLGRALLQHVIARAKASPRGSSPVCLTVFCTNLGARELYLAEGFVVTRRLWVVRSDSKASGE